MGGLVGFVSFVKAVGFKGVSFVYKISFSRLANGVSGREDLLNRDK
jgi:hypothetical protein